MPVLKRTFAYTKRKVCFAPNISYSARHWMTPKCTMLCYCNHVMCCPTAKLLFHQRSINVDLPMSVAYPWRWNVF
jgi:hypothetical protein